MGDGGFWHNGLTSGIGKRSFLTRTMGLPSSSTTGYSAATGRAGYPLITRFQSEPQHETHDREQQCAAIGVDLGENRSNNTYDVARHARRAARCPDIERQRPKGRRLRNQNAR